LKLNKRTSRLEEPRAGGEVVRLAKVERVLQALRDGSFRIDSAIVADRMLEDAKLSLAKRK
jgi:anti-sigma28 factor (negative regulator of flagellin synthesis)